MIIKKIGFPGTQEYYVIVFDLCSSSTILEDLQEQGKLSVWKKFWEEIYAFLVKSSVSNDKYIIYKFVGDGFILLYNPNYEDRLLTFCIRLSNFINRKVLEIIEKYMNVNTERTGITIGVDRGKLIKLIINENEEYTGKAINVASRLQSTLKKPENANKLLISKAVRNGVCEKYVTDIYKSVVRTLSNLFGDKAVNCYEIDLTIDLNDYLKEEIDE